MPKPMMLIKRIGVRLAALSLLLLESPGRPPMLPLFGKVKGFLCDSATIIALRPGPPPSTSSTDMTAAVQTAYTTIRNATRDQMRIVQYWGDGVGTFTPPGHWNAIADAAISCWDIKYFYFNPRPTQMNANIKTLTGIPNFPSYVSGHSMFSAAAAAVLGHILPARAGAYMSMAQEAANSRVYAGIHYTVDCTAGFTVGTNVGNYAVKRAQGDGAE